ncbi:MAG: class II fructose-bisphosphate aldolase [Firmicutes bacterium]|nr:class II fructose-bisphosphate aldolase [Bacillota bacterium]
MLVNLAEMLRDVPLARMAFNVTSVEAFSVLVDLAERHEVPLILQISPRYLDDLGADFVRQFVIPRLQSSAERFTLHFDHAPSPSAIAAVIDWGFTSVMFDGSLLPMDENIRLTQEVLDLARPRGISVEAEIGHVGGVEDGAEGYELQLTSVESARAFVAACPVDALAVAVGNAHGLYQAPPQLLIDRIRAISDAVGIPLVLHGGTGIPLSDLVAAAQAGMKKINIGTELKQAWLNGARRGAAQYQEVDQVRALMRDEIRAAVMKYQVLLGL